MAINNYEFSVDIDTTIGGKAEAPDTSENDNKQTVSVPPDTTATAARSSINIRRDVKPVTTSYIRRVPRATPVFKLPEEALMTTTITKVLNGMAAAGENDITCTSKHFDPAECEAFREHPPQLTVASSVDDGFMRAVPPSLDSPGRAACTSSFAAVVENTEVTLQLQSDDVRRPKASPPATIPSSGTSSIHTTVHANVGVSEELMEAVRADACNATATAEPEDPLARNVAESRASYESWLKEEPNNTFALHHMGILVEESERSEEGIRKAESYYRLAFQSNPNNVDALVSLATLLGSSQDLGRKKEALTYFEYAMKSPMNWDQSRPRLLKNYALALKNVDKTDENVDKLLQKCVSSVDVHNASVFLILGDNEHQRHRPDLAQRLYELALVSDPDNNLCHAKLGVLAVERKELLVAQHHFSSAIRVDPLQYKQWYQLGRVFEQLHHLQETLGNNNNNNDSNTNKKSEVGGCSSGTLAAVAVQSQNFLAEAYTCYSQGMHVGKKKRMKDRLALLFRQCKYLEKNVFPSLASHEIRSKSVHAAYLIASAADGIGGMGGAMMSSRYLTNTPSNATPTPTNSFSPLEEIGCGTERNNSKNRKRKGGEGSRSQENEGGEVDDDDDPEESQEDDDDEEEEEDWDTSEEDELEKVLPRASTSCAAAATTTTTTTTSPEINNASVCSSSFKASIRHCLTTPQSPSGLLCIRGHRMIEVRRKPPTYSRLATWACEECHLSISSSDRMRYGAHYCRICKYDLCHTCAYEPRVSHLYVDPPKEIGHGGMGKVFRVYNARRGHVTAVKRILEAAVERDKAEELIANERMHMRKCRCPNVVTVYKTTATAAISHDGKASAAAASFSAASGPSFAMELMGASLLDVLSCGPVHETIARQWVCDILCGLAVLREKNVFHRDVKPGNILLSKKNTFTHVSRNTMRSIKKLSGSSGQEYDCHEGQDGRQQALSPSSHSDSKTANKSEPHRHSVGDNKLVTCNNDNECEHRARAMVFLANAVRGASCSSPNTKQHPLLPASTSTLLSACAELEPKRGTNFTHHLSKSTEYPPLSGASKNGIDMDHIYTFLQDMSAVDDDDGIMTPNNSAESNMGESSDDHINSSNNTLIRRGGASNSANEGSLPPIVVARRAKLADFGIATIGKRYPSSAVGLPANKNNSSGTNNSQTPSNVLSRGFTRHTRFAGTECYAAPESLSEKGIVNHKSDIYSLGLVWHNLLTGSTSSPQYELTVDAGRGTTSSIIRFDFPTSYDMRIILTKMLAKDLYTRPSAPEILDYPYFKHLRTARSNANIISKRAEDAEAKAVEIGGATQQTQEAMRALSIKKILSDSSHGAESLGAYTARVQRWLERDKYPNTPLQHRGGAEENGGGAGNAATADLEERTIVGGGVMLGQQQGAVAQKTTGAGKHTKVQSTTNVAAPPTHNDSLNHRCAAVAIQQTEVHAGKEEESVQINEEASSKREPLLFVASSTVTTSCEKDVKLSQPKGEQNETPQQTDSSDVRNLRGGEKKEKEESRQGEINEKKGIKNDLLLLNDNDNDNDDEEYADSASCATSRTYYSSDDGEEDNEPYVNVSDEEAEADNGNDEAGASINQQQQQQQHEDENACPDANKVNGRSGSIKQQCNNVCGGANANSISVSSNTTNSHYGTAAAMPNVNSKPPRLHGLPPRRSAMQSKSSFGNLTALEGPTCPESPTSASTATSAQTPSIFISPQIGTSEDGGNSSFSQHRFVSGANNTYITCWERTDWLEVHLTLQQQQQLHKQLRIEQHENVALKKRVEDLESQNEMLMKEISKLRQKT